MTDSQPDRVQIQVLQGLEPVRKRPKLFIGSTDTRGLHRLVDEVIDNAVEEYLAGHCDRIEVILNPDASVTVIDNGRGIPTDIDSSTKKSFLESVLTMLRACGRCGSGDSYKIAGGMYGIGLAVVNALSEWLEVTVWRDGNRYSQRYEKGDAVTELQIQPTTETRTGTTLTFKPDREIFKPDVACDRIPLAIRLQELAYLCPNIEIVFRDRRSSLQSTRSTEEIYHYPGGIKDYVAQINRNRHPVNEEVIYIQAERDRINVEVALQWRAESELEYCDRQLCDTIHLLSFANLVPTVDGGTHVVGAKQAVTRVLTQIARQNNLMLDSDADLSWQQIRNSLTGVISVKLFDPEYEGANKLELANSKVQDVVDSLVGDVLNEYFIANPDIANAILNEM